MNKEFIKKMDVSLSYYCGGKIVSTKQDIDFRWEGELLVVRDVPVLVCNQCGERYYSASISEKLDTIAAKRHKARSFIKVPVFDWRSFTTSFA